jgi:hypothetical protein
VDLAFAPINFFVASGIELAFEHRQAEISWELFRGRLLDAAHTRVLRSFEAWNVYWVDDGKRSEEPILAVKLDVAAGQIHVVRAIHSYVWEGFDAGGNVIESRETTRWVRELVGTIHLGAFETGGELVDEIICLIFQCVVGTSRLPLTSLENPLPTFTFGRFFYIHCSRSGEGSGRSRSIGDLLRRVSNQPLARREEVKLLEFVLRATPNHQLALAVHLLGLRQSMIANVDEGISSLVRELFNEVSLSPYTDFVDKVLSFLDLLQQQGIWRAEERIDYLSWILRHLVRHLTAFDLRTFHHRGANYPDALLLDAVLKHYLQVIEMHPELFSSTPEDNDLAMRRKRRRRRALRQGWLLRRWYEGLSVPEVPTSPGENRWVLPSHVRIPEEHILEPGNRRKRLFDDDRLDVPRGSHAADVLTQSMTDLQEPEELQELGMAVFLDRPLGALKHPGEPDCTPLLSYLAFSRFIARKRLHFLEDIGLLKGQALNRFRESVDGLVIPGIPVSDFDKTSRPGAVSITDAARAAADFVLLRTTTTSMTEFLKCFRFEELDSRISFLNWPDASPRLVVDESSPQEPSLLLSFYDSQLSKRLEFEMDASMGYHNRAGLELPRAGLQVTRAWAEDGSELPVAPTRIPTN